MSYDIYIGNAVLEEGEDLEVQYAVDAHIELSAPSFPYDALSRQANSRHPGYCQWGDFCREVGLYDLFFGEESGLMRDHPGIKPLTTAHLEAVREALARHREQHPDTIPGFDWSPVSGEPDDGVRGRDGVLARLLWLEWWIEWALQNCEKPAIYNY
jgi:hypothetical protein